MSSSQKKKPVAGSEQRNRLRPYGAGKPRGDERVEIMVLLHYGRADQDFSHVDELANMAPVHRDHLSQRSFADLHGANSEHADLVATFAANHGLAIIETDIPHRMVILAGTISDLSSAFSVDLAYFEHAEGFYRGFEGPIHVPSELSGVVQGVLGLHNRPVTRPRSSLLTGNARGDARGKEEPVFPPQQLAEFYQFPHNLTGRGQRIALIELTGGYRTEDLQVYFDSFGLKMPTIKDLSVAGGQNKPIGDPNSMDSEVVMDIEVVGALAQDAEIRVYFTEKSEKGFLQAIKKAIADDVSIISISWGLPELFVSHATKVAFNAAFKDAAARGITVCVASGDHGSRGNVTQKDDPDGLAHVSFPSSSPYVLACGGSQLIQTDQKIKDEVVWNQPPKNWATGGGISDLYDKPGYQDKAKVPPSANPTANRGRGVPDVAACAIGYPVRVDGKTRILGGTSAVAPLWAALIARINEKLGKNIGFINPVLYGLADTDIFRDIVSGDNGAYQARRGWDACTGLGSPRGDVLLQAMGTRGSIQAVRKKLKAADEA